MVQHKRREALQRSSKYFARSRLAVRDENIKKLLDVPRLGYSRVHTVGSFLENHNGDVAKQRSAHARYNSWYSSQIAVLCKTTMRNDQTLRCLENVNQGPLSRKPRKLFGPIKPFLVYLYLKVYMPETSCMKRTSIHIKNTWIKQLCNRKVRYFAMAFRVQNVSRAFAKRSLGQISNCTLCFIFSLEIDKGNQTKWLQSISRFIGKMFKSFFNRYLPFHSRRS